MKRTAAFYEENAFMYSLRTRNVNMTDILEVFAALLPPGGRVLYVDPFGKTYQLRDEKDSFAAEKGEWLLT